MTANAHFFFLSLVHSKGKQYERSQVFVLQYIYLTHVAILICALSVIVIDG